MQQLATQPDVQLLTVRQVQDLLNIDRSTVYRMAADGRLPSIRIGKQLRFPAPDIHALVAGASDTPSHASPTALDPDYATGVVAAAAELLGVMMVVTDLDGEPITPIVHACPGFERLVEDPATLTACLAEWREMADDADLAPRFRPGQLGFECARAFIRSGSSLVGMVLVGGVAPADAPADTDFRHLDEAERDHVLAALPQVARVLTEPASAHFATRVQPPTSKTHTAHNAPRARGLSTQGEQ